jgi:hypothetical protein
MSKAPKRVRFAESVVCYSAPPTPSPTLSDTSLPSSSGPQTPSPQSFGLPLPTPLNRVPLSLGPVRIHYLLGYDQNPPIDHNLTHHPTFIKTTADRRPLSTLELSQPATTPPLPYLTLIAPQFPWHIFVPAYSKRHGSFVTILDVLTTLYRSLRLNVTSTEFECLPTQEDKLRVNAAYVSRYRRFGDMRTREAEERNGVRRIDFLTGHRFLGLSSTTRGPDVWVINVM